MKQDSRVLLGSRGLNELYQVLINTAYHIYLLNYVIVKENDTISGIHSDIAK